MKVIVPELDVITVIYTIQRILKTNKMIYCSSNMTEVAAVAAPLKKNKRKNNMMTRPLSVMKMMRITLPMTMK